MYMAPEILFNDMNSGHNKSADIWSFGIIAYLIAYGKFPFGFSPRSSIIELKEKIYNDLEFPNDEFENLNELLK